MELYDGWGGLLAADDDSECARRYADQLRAVQLGAFQRDFLERVQLDRTAEPD